MRYRARLVHHRSSCKAQIHGVMAKNGILPVRGNIWGPFSGSHPARFPGAPRGLRHAQTCVVDVIGVVDVIVTRHQFCEWLYGVRDSTW